MARRGTVKLTGPSGVTSFEWEAQKGGGYEVYRIHNATGTTAGDIKTADTFAQMKVQLAELLWESLDEVV